MGFVEIVSLGILLLVGLAGLIQGIMALTSRGLTTSGTAATGTSRWLLSAVYLAGGLAALIVGGLWLVSL